MEFFERLRIENSKGVGAICFGNIDYSSRNDQRKEKFGEEPSAGQRRFHVHHFPGGPDRLCCIGSFTGGHAGIFYGGDCRRVFVRHARHRPRYAGYVIQPYQRDTAHFYQALSIGGLCRYRRYGGNGQGD